MVNEWSNIGVEKPGAVGRCRQAQKRSKRGQTITKKWSNNGRIIAKNGQIMGKSWANHGQIMVKSWSKSWSNHGQIMVESPLAGGQVLIDKRRFLPVDETLRIAISVLQVGPL
jgi:hypothetical protein